MEAWWRLNMKLAFLAFLIAFLLSFGGAQANHAYGPKWPSRPEQLTLRSEMGPEWSSTIAAKTSDWNLSSVIEMTRVTGACEGTEDICIRPFNCPTCLGAQTNLVTKGKNIRYAEVNINTFVYALPDNSVLCHELGHALGLDHAPYGDPTCMTPGPTSEWPNTHDYTELERIY